MIMLTAILMYIILAAAVLSGIIAVFLAVSAVFSGGSVGDFETGEEVELFVDTSLFKNNEKRQKRRRKDSEGFIGGAVADLPEVFHILTGLSLNLPAPLKVKGREISRGDIDYLIMGPRRLFVLSGSVGENTLIEGKILLISEYLRQNLSKDFKVVGWHVDETDGGETGKNRVKLSDLRKEIIRLERYSQGKNCLPVSEHSHEILSVLKLSRWEKGVSSDINESVSSAI